MEKLSGHRDEGVPLTSCHYSALGALKVLPVTAEVQKGIFLGYENIVICSQARTHGVHRWLFLVPSSICKWNC